MVIINTNSANTTSHWESFIWRGQRVSLVRDPDDLEPCEHPMLGGVCDAAPWHLWCPECGASGGRCDETC